MRRHKVRTWHLKFNDNEGPNFGQIIVPPGSVVSGGGDHATVTLGIGFDPDDPAYGGPYFPDSITARGWWFDQYDVDEDGNVVLNPPGPLPDSPR